MKRKGKICWKRCAVTGIANLRSHWDVLRYDDLLLFKGSFLFYVIRFFSVRLVIVLLTSFQGCHVRDLRRQAIVVGLQQADFSSKFAAAASFTAYLDMSLLRINSCRSCRCMSCTFVHMWHRNGSSSIHEPPLSPEVKYG